MDIDNLNLEDINEIRTKLDIREAEIKSQKLQTIKLEVENKLNFLRIHSESILQCIEHDRSSCSDEDPCNGYSDRTNNARCNKCHLIEILDGDYGNDFDVKFEVIITRVEDMI